MAKWYVRPKWHKWLPVALFVKMQKKKYLSALLYDDGDYWLTLTCESERRRQDERYLPRIAYLEKVIADHADLIIQKACSQ